MKNRIKTLIQLISHYPIKTIWLNFRCLPFKQAVKLPIFLYSKTVFRNLSGKIIIDCSSVYPNMIKIGADWWYPATARPQTIWSIYGTLILKGPISFPQGTYILVANNALLQFGTNGTVVGTNTKIMCFEKIILGNNTRLTWDCQIYDTSFHYVEIDGNCKKLTAPIVIGNNVWIGNNTTITKGVTIPNWSIITSHSMVNKDLSSFDEHCLFAGIPATLKKQKVTRIYDESKQKELDTLFNYNRNSL